MNVNKLKDLVRQGKISHSEALEVMDIKPLQLDQREALKQQNYNQGLNQKSTLKDIFFPYNSTMY